MMTAKVIPFFRDVSFDPDTTHIMGQAFDGACKELPHIGQSDLVKSLIAKRIIEVAKTGERDPNRLRDRALQAFGSRLGESEAVGQSALSSKRMRFGLAPSPFSGRI
jgi:hypothetical protein